MNKRCWCCRRLTMASVLFREGLTLRCVRCGATQVEQLSRPSAVAEGSARIMALFGTHIGGGDSGKKPYGYELPTGYTGLRMPWDKGAYEPL